MSGFEQIQFSGVLISDIYWICIYKKTYIFFIVEVGFYKTFINDVMHVSDPLSGVLSLGRDGQLQWRAEDVHGEAGLRLPQHRQG